MSLIRRFGFFIMLNFVIMLTLGVIYSLISGVFFPPDEYGRSTNNGLAPLLVFSLLWGFGGAFISLFMSKFLAKRMFRLKMLDAGTSMGAEREVLTLVQNLSRNAGLPNTPEVGIYDSPEMNAFATGPSRRNSLVAVSTGLLNSMDRNQLEGVLAHEVAHIANGDMVTMTLLQGVINSFVLFFARIVSRLVASSMSSNNERGSYWLEFALSQVFQIIFGMLGMIVLSFYSRAREFRADQGGARFASKDKMVSALQALQKQVGLRANGPVDGDAEGAFASFKISNRKVGGLTALFSTHPPLEVRIARLQRG